MASDKKIEDGLEHKIELTQEELKNLLRVQHVVDDRYGDDEIDLSELWQSLMRRKMLIAGVTIVMTLMVTIVSMKISPKYESMVLIAAVSSGNSSNSLLAKYDGLASMAGIALPGSSDGVSQAQEAQAILVSYRFLSEYIKDKALKQELFPERWSVDEQRWLPKEESLFGKKNEVEFKYKGQENLSDGEPSMGESVAAFKKILSISEERKTGLIRLKISWINPVQASIWANDLVQRVDDELRQKNILESKDVMAYVKEKLPTIELQDLRMIALTMMEEQVKRITFAEVNKEYVFKVIDPAIVAENPVSPKKGLIIAVGFVLGLMLSIFIALILNWREKNKLLSK